MRTNPPPSGSGGAHAPRRRAAALLVAASPGTPFALGLGGEGRPGPAPTYAQLRAAAVTSRAPAPRSGGIDALGSGA